MTITPIGLERQTNLVRRNSQDHRMACFGAGPLSDTPGGSEGQTPTGTSILYSPECAKRSRQWAVRD
jgi:hypothetical protein